MPMHVITRKRIREAQEDHPDCAEALAARYELMRTGRYTTFAELKETFGSVDKIGKLHVFNIGGNKLRLIAAIHLNTGKVFIRYVLTHKEYDKESWKKRRDWLTPRSWCRERDSNSHTVSCTRFLVVFRQQLTTRCNTLQQADLGT